MVSLKSIFCAYLWLFLWMIPILMLDTPVLAQGDQPPQIQPIADQQVDVGKPLALTIRADDAEGDAISIQLLDQPPPGLNFADQGDGSASLVWTPNENQIGTHTLRVHATQTDGSPNPSAVVTFKIIVKEAPFVNLVVQISQVDAEVFGNSRPIYDISIANQGNIPATSVVITDAITDAPFEFVNFAQPQTDQGTCTTENEQFVCQIGTIPAGGTIEIVSQVILNGDEEDEAQFTNQVVVTSAELDTVLENNRASVTTRVLPRHYADIAIENMDVPHVVHFDDIVLSFDLRNLGNSPSQVTFFPQVQGPGEIDIRRIHYGPKTNCTRTISDIICSYDGLAVGATIRVIVRIRPTDIGKVEIDLLANAELYDPDDTNDRKLHTVEVKAGNEDLEILKTANKTEAEVGELITYSLLARNLSHRTVRNITIHDRLPLAMSFVQIPDFCMIHEASHNLVCKDIKLFEFDPTNNPNLYEKIITYVARANLPGSHKNTANIGAFRNDDPNMENNLPTFTVQVVEPQTTKTAITIGQQMTSTGKLTNTVILTNTGNFSQIPIDIIVDGQEHRVTTDEHGQAQVDLGENPQQFSISTAITPSALSDVTMQVHLNEMPPTGNTQLSSTQSISASVILNTAASGSQQLQLDGNNFSWQDRRDVSTGAFNFTIPAAGEGGGSIRSRHVSTPAKPVNLNFVLDANWDYTLYLPTIMR